MVLPIRHSKFDPNMDWKKGLKTPLLLNNFVKVHSVDKKFPFTDFCPLMYECLYADAL